MEIESCYVILASFLSSGKFGSGKIACVIASCWTVDFWAIISEFISVRWLLCSFDNSQILQIKHWLVVVMLWTVLLSGEKCDLANVLIQPDFRCIVYYYYHCNYLFVLSEEMNRLYWRRPQMKQCLEVWENNRKTEWHWGTLQKTENSEGSW